MSEQATLTKLSNMILNKKLEGMLDQGEGILILYPPKEERKSYGHALDIVKNSSECVDALAALSQKIVN